MIAYFGLRHFWAALGLSVIINLLTLLLLYGSSLLLEKLGYEFNGLLLPIPVMLLFWWLSVLADGVLLKLFLPKSDNRRVYTASVAMNALSYLFVYFFVANSH